MEVLNDDVSCHQLSPGRRSVDVEVKVEPGMAPGCVLLAWSPLLGARDAVLAAAGYVPQRDLLRQEVTVRN